MTSYQAEKQVDKKDAYISKRHDRIQTKVLDLPLPVVHIVAESRSIDDGQLDAEIPLLQLGLDDLDFGRLVELLGESVSVVFGCDEFGREEGVDQGRLS